MQKYNQQNSRSESYDIIFHFLDIFIIYIQCILRLLLYKWSHGQFNLAFFHTNCTKNTSLMSK